MSENKKYYINEETGEVFNPEYNDNTTEMVIINASGFAQSFKTRSNKVFKTDRFIKLMTSSYNDFIELEDKALKLLFILTKTVQFKDIEVVADYNIHEKDFKGSKSSYYRNLNILIDKGFIKKTGRGRKAKYYLSRKYLRNG